MIFLGLCKESRAVLALASGDTLKNEAVIASLDGPERRVHDNRVG